MFVRRFLVLIAAIGAAGVAGCGSAAGDKCGGVDGSTCSGDLFCTYPDNSCGLTGGSGVCAERPVSCDISGPQVRACGCDGVVYPNGCLARSNGQDRAKVSHCSLSTGEFACGETSICSDDASYAYCRKQLASHPGGEPSFSCAWAAALCVKPYDCSCFSAEEGCGECVKDAQGNVTLTCQ